VTPKIGREQKMGRLRIWTDATTEQAIGALHRMMKQSPSRIAGTALTLLWVVMSEKERGRKIVSLNPDGTVAQEIM
jgi:hypothetical protein